MRLTPVGKATMKATDKDYQKEVVDFLKPTSVKMGLDEARSVYGKEIAVGAKAVKALDTFEKSLETLSKVIEKHASDPYRVKLGMRRCMDTLGNLDDYKREY